PRLVNRWREYLQHVVRADQPVFGPWHDLVTAHRDRSPDEIDRILARWMKARSGTAAGELNPLVREALLHAAPRSPVEVARAYGNLLTSVYRQSLSSAPRPKGFNQLLSVLM